MDYTDLVVPRKAVKFNHSLTHLYILDQASNTDCIVSWARFNNAD